MSKVNGKEFLSDLKLYSDYLKWDEKEERYETWEEACDKVLETHRRKYGKKIEKYLKEVAPYYYNKELLASQRSLQFRGDKIFQHNARLYNCFHKEEKFVTSEGVKSFSDFKQGDKIKVLTHKGQWKDAIVGKYGEQMLNKVYLKRGASEENIVKVTENHRWILQDGTETTTLAVGDRLYKPHNTFSDFDFENATPFEKLYWCYGFVYGDGTKVKNDGVHKYSMVRLCGNDVKYLDRFKEMGFETSSSLSLKGDVMIYTGKYLKTAPNPKEDSPELIRAFVSGYLAADAEKNNNPSGKTYNNIQSSEKDHIDFIRQCFPIAGIWIISEKDLTGQETNYGKRPYTILFYITDTMGSKYNGGWKVEKIERYQQEEVWCLEVEDDNSFVMPNGIVTGNCTVSYAYSPDVLNKGFYVLLCGCGLGVSLRQKFIQQLPTIDKRNNDVKLFVIPDTIEGWAESVKVLMSSYCKHPSLYEEYYGFQIKFDYSQIRPKGALISGGYKAPGHEGLQQSLERIETLLNNNTGEFRSIIMYDIFMHISDAVLSGGVRRSAQNMVFDYDDKDMLNAKIGNWRQTYPHRARSNNSVALQRNQFSKETFKELVELNQGDNDVGFVIVNDEDEMFNPCFEIGFNFYNRIENKDEAVFHFCNLNEVSASACVDEKGNFSVEKFNELCRAAAILGTLQAGYTDFPYLGKQTEDIVRGEALLGVSITGWMTRPELFNELILMQGARIVRETNKEVAEVIGINQSARTTTVKPSGNACTTFNTKIKTDKGIMTLNEIFNYCLDTTINPDNLLPKIAAKPKKKLKIYDENNELAEITGLYSNGLSETYEIEFEDGQIYSFTGEHKLKTKNGWKQVKDLTLKDEIIAY